MGSLVHGDRILIGMTNDNCSIVFWGFFTRKCKTISVKAFESEGIISSLENQKIKIMEAICHFPVNLAQCYNVGEFEPDWRWCLAHKLVAACHDLDCQNIHSGLRQFIRAHRFRILSRVNCKMGIGPPCLVGPET